MKIVNCGDSYTVGIGCPEQRKDSYASIIGKYFGVDDINLGKPGATNYVISLQVEYAIEMNADLIIINTTSSDRCEWIDSTKQVNTRVRTLRHVNYHDYFNDHYFRNDPLYEPFIFSEQIAGVGMARPHRLAEEPESRIQQLLDYYGLVYEKNIKIDYDIGLMCMNIIRMQQKGIRFLFLANDSYFSALSEVLENSQIIALDFVTLSQTFPDQMGTKHCSPDGHRYAGEQILSHLEKL